MGVCPPCQLHPWETEYVLHQGLPSLHYQWEIGYWDKVSCGVTPLKDLGTSLPRHIESPRGPPSPMHMLYSASWTRRSTCHITLPTMHFGARIVFGSWASGSTKYCHDRVSGLVFLEPGL